MGPLTEKACWMDVSALGGGGHFKRPGTRRGSSKGRPQPSTPPSHHDPPIMNQACQWLARSSLNRCQCRTRNQFSPSRALMKGLSGP